MTVMSVISSPAFHTQLGLALGSNNKAQWFARTITTEVQKNPKLKECSALSFANSVLLAAQMKLEIGEVLGQVYLIPYGNTCKLIVGYRGLVQLAYRSSRIKDIHADVVYENDEFEFTQGENKTLIHKPKLGNRGDRIIAFYAYARLKDGGFEHVVLETKEVDAIKNTSKSQNVWKDHYVEMGKKTAIRRLFKVLPVDSAVIKAMSAEDEMENTNEEITPAINIDCSEDSVPSPTPALTKTDVLLNQVNAQKIEFEAA